jgi:hypothetical protein
VKKNLKMLHNNLAFVGSVVRLTTAYRG